MILGQLWIMLWEVAGSVWIFLMHAVPSKSTYASRHVSRFLFWLKALPGNKATPHSVNNRWHNVFVSLMFLAFKRCL